MIIEGIALSQSNVFLQSLPQGHVLGKQRGIMGALIDQSNVQNSQAASSSKVGQCKMQLVLQWNWSVVRKDVIAILVSPELQDICPPGRDFFRYGH